MNELTLIFPSRSLCLQLLEEVTVIEENGMWLYQGPRFEKNLYNPCEGGDGRCLVQFPASEEVEAFLVTQWESFDVKFSRDGKPADWVEKKDTP